MSKFLDRIEEITQGAPAPMGFGAARRQKTPGMALVGVISSNHTSGISAIASMELDAVLLSDLPDGSALPEPVKELKTTPWGVRAASLTESQAQQYREGGCDLLAFGLPNTSVVAVTADSVARILCVQAGMEEPEVRTIDALPLDALLVNATDHSGPWTLDELARVAAISRRSGKYILLEVSHAPGVRELEVLRDIGVHALVVDVATVSGDALSGMKKALLEMPRPQSRRRERSAALLPGSVYSAGQHQPAREEPDEDDDDE